MKTVAVVTVVLIGLNAPMKAQINTGDLMFVGFNADGKDGFSVVNLVDIPANSTIYFTDNEWNGSAIGAGGAFNNANEGEITWSTGASVIAAGTVTNFTETNSTANAGYGASNGTISGIINLNASNEVLYAFLGTNDITPTLFLSAIANDGFNNTTGTLTNTGLTAGTNATSIIGDEDVMVYSGSTSCNGTVAACASMIANASNWSTQDGAGDQSADGTYPDFTSDVPISFGGSLLPIDLVSFTGVENKFGVRIEWSTASELNNDYFELFRSFDGENYELIATVLGAGTTTEPNKYSYSDTIPEQFEHIYYQLKQTDFNGHKTAFRLIHIHRKSFGPQLVNPELTVYPNPSNGTPIFVESRLNFNKVEINDLQGKTIVEYPNTNSNVLEVRNLTRGIYFVIVHINELVYHRKLIVRE